MCPEIILGSKVEQVSEGRWLIAAPWSGEGCFPRLVLLVAAHGQTSKTSPLPCKHVWAVPAPASFPTCRTNEQDGMPGLHQGLSQPAQPHSIHRFHKLGGLHDLNCVPRGQRGAWHAGRDALRPGHHLPADIVHIVVEDSALGRCEGPRQLMCDSAMVSGGQRGQSWERFGLQRHHEGVQEGSSCHETHLGGQGDALELPAPPLGECSLAVDSLRGDGGMSQHFEWYL